MKKLLLPAVLLLLLSEVSCRKSYGTQFTGRVVDDNTGAVLPNARLTLVIYYSDRFSGSSVTGSTNTGMSDANGNFAMTLEDREKRNQTGKKYYITIHSEAQHFTDSYEFYPDYVDKRNVYHDIAVDGIGRIHLIVKNTSPYDQNDFIGNFYIDQPGNITQGYSGTAVNDTFLVQNHSGTRLLHYTVVKHSVSAQYTDTLHIPGFAEGYYEIDY